MGLKQRLYASLGANLAGQAVTILIQLVSVPLFLYCWSLEQYGSWLLLTAIPTYFALADVGFLAVTINKMTMIGSGDDAARVNVLFQTAIKLCLIAIVGAMVVAGAAVLLVNAKPLDVTSNKIALLLMVMSAVLAMSGGLIDAVFRSSGEYALGTNLVTGARLVEWLGMIAGLLWGRSFVSAAAGQLTGRVIATLVGWQIAARRHPTKHWGISGASSHEFRELLAPAVSFMAFPVANAISIQGMSLIVGSIFGPAFLAVFSTYRTLSRALVQAVTIIGRSMWPEVSRRFGAGDVDAVMSIYRKGTFVSIAVASSLSVLLSLFGGAILHLWTSNRVPFDANLFLLFLAATAITSWWQMGMVVLSATNNHMALSASFLAGSVGSILVPVVLGDSIGEYAPMVGLIGFELFMVVMVLVHVRSFKRDKLGLA